MKNIAPIVYTTDGPICTQLHVWTINDQYTECAFGFHLLTAEGELVNTGQLTCSGEDYSSWDRTPDGAYAWVAANLPTPVTIIS